MRRHRFPFLLTLLFFIPAIVQADDSAGLLFVYPGVKDPEAFIRNHKCLLGMWAKEEQTGEGWKGALHGPVFNYKPDRLYVTDSVKVLKTESPAATNALNNVKYGAILVVQSESKPGRFEIAAFSAPKPDMDDIPWLSVERRRDIARGFFHSEKYRYAALIPNQTKRLDSDEPREVFAALNLLREVGEDARPALPKVLELVESENDHVSALAIRAMTAIGGDETRKKIPYVVKAVENEVKRHASIEALAKYGPEASAAIPALIRMLQAADQKFAPTINPMIETLGKIGPEDPRVHAALKPYLKHEYDTTRQVAAEALKSS